MEQGVHFHLVESLEEANDFISWVRQLDPKGWLALDTETGGLDYYRDALRLVQFGDTHTGWAMDASEWKGVIRQALNEYPGRIVGHNAKFDMHFLHYAGLPVNNPQWHDTRTMAHLLDSSKGTSLKDLGKRFISDHAQKGQQDLKLAMQKEGWGWDTIPTDFPAYWQYACLDTVLTARIAEHFWPEVQDGFADLYDLELGVLMVLADAERRGARIDRRYCQAQYEEMHKEADELRFRITALYGIANPGSGSQIAAALIRDGVKLDETTRTGAWKMSEDVLETIDHPMVREILRLRETEKIANTYIHNFLQLADSRDYIHAHVNPLGARTGRMSCTRPNLQNLPRGRRVRDAFVPRPDHVLVSADYDQVELRLLAHFAQEESMIEAIRAGDDLHELTATKVFGDRYERSKHRPLGKNGNFGKIYGIGVESFARQQGITIAESQEFDEGYRRAYPGVERFMNRMQRTVNERAHLGVGHIYTPWGRRHAVEVDAAYRGVNYLIQGTAADLLKQKIVDLDAAGLMDYFVLPVHDELIWDVPKDEVEEFTKALAPVMEEHERFCVPITIGVDILENRWGDKYAA
jgi:DNA polymerase I